MPKFVYAINNGDYCGIYGSLKNFENRCPAENPVRFNKFGDAFNWIKQGPIVYPSVQGQRHWSYKKNGVPMVFTDGSAFGNGPNCKKAGFGIFWGDFHPYNICAALIDKRLTNNRAELMAAIVATEQAKERGFSALHICTDSKYAKICLERMFTWRKYGWRQYGGNMAKNVDLLKRWIKVLDSGIDVTMEHTSAHQNDTGYMTNGNNMADWLAKLGAEMCQQ